jgi:hypothetical protein
LQDRKFLFAAAAAPGDTSLLAPCSIMLNILGEADDEEGVRLGE